MHPRAKFHGPKWFRFGWSERVNGLGRVVGWVYTVTVGRRFRIQCEWKVK